MRRIHRAGGAKGPRLDVATLVFRTRWLIWSIASRRLTQEGSSPPTLRLLAHLVRKGPSAQVDLADATAQHAAGVSRLVDELERAGLVARTRDPGDRRRIVVRATDAGSAEFDRMFPHVTRAADEVLAPLTADERATLVRLLEKVVAAAEASAPTGAESATSRARPARGVAAAKRERA